MLRYNKQLRDPRAICTSLLLREQPTDQLQDQQLDQLQNKLPGRLSDLLQQLRRQLKQPPHQTLIVPAVIQLDQLRRPHGQHHDPFEQLGDQHNDHHHANRKH